jgi:SGNH hydrolase-like domain, acetyltransferase AlgX
VSGACAAAVLGARLLRGRSAALAPLRTWFQIRLWLYFVLAGALLPTLLTAVGWMGRESALAGTLWLSGLLSGWALWILLVLLLPASARLADHGVVRALDLALFNGIVLLLVAEGALSVIRDVAPSPLLWDDSSAAATIEQQRGGDATDFQRYNSRGYPDEEFWTAGPNDYVVALVTDSFGVGSVPYRYNFATVAERLLQERLRDRYERVAVDNYGIITIGMPEYLHLLGTEVLPSDPDQVVLGIFVGNDIDGVRPQRSRDRLRMQRWLVAQTLLRMFRIGTGVESFERRWAVGVETGAAPEPAFLHDPSLEEPYFTEAAFHRIERERLETFDTRSRKTALRFAAFFEALDLARRWVGSELLVLLIPDELQVNDQLYDAIRPAHEEPGTYDREYPQKRIVQWCRERGVRVLDLLPILRQAEHKGRTYHLRDTHWNARGNRVAGVALYEALVGR